MPGSSHRLRPQRRTSLRMPVSARGIVQRPRRWHRSPRAVTGQDAPLADDPERARTSASTPTPFPATRRCARGRKHRARRTAGLATTCPSPCHKDESWVGKRQMLVDMGWGLAVVYVGQQTWGTHAEAAHAREAAALREGGHDLQRRSRWATTAASPMGRRHRVTAERRISPSARSSSSTSSGWRRCPRRCAHYYRAWARTLLKDGRYRPGVYVHEHNAQEVYDDLKAEFAAAGVDEEPRIWVASGAGLRGGQGAAGRRLCVRGRVAGDDRRRPRRGRHQAAGGRERVGLELALRPRRS